MGLGDRLAEVLDGVPYAYNEYLCRCPLCGDSKRSLTKKRFSINTEQNVFQCFNCGAKGGNTEILSILYELEGSVEVTPDLIKSVLEKSSGRPTVKKESEISEDILELLQKSVPLSRAPRPIKRRAILDLIPRKVFTREELLSLLVVPPGVHKGWDWRVIIPVSAQVFQGKGCNGEDPKYLSPPGMEILFDEKFPNHQNCPTDIPILVGEGILDFHSFPRIGSTTSVGAKVMKSTEFLNLLKPYDLAILVPDSDPDGYEVLYELLYRQEIRNNIRIFYPQWADPSLKDPNDMLRYKSWDKEGMREYIIENSVELKVAGVKFGREMREIRRNERKKSRWNKTKNSRSPR